MQRLQIVDFLKGYSIFTIMIFHFLQYLDVPSPLDKAICFGGTGVHLFVLLSGFGLYYSFIQKPLKYSVFLKRRLSKVYVPYIFIVLLSALISVFTPIYENSLYSLGGHIFLYKMFDESIMVSYGYQLWFMSMILQFYLSFHLLIWLKSKLKNSLFLITSSVISLSWAGFVLLIGKGDERIWSSFFLQYFWEFALGIVIAEKVYKKERLIGENFRHSFFLITGLICSAIYAYLALVAGDFGKLFNDFFALTAYASLAIYIYNLNLKAINSFFLFIGEISLSVYLLHILLLLSISVMADHLGATYIVIFTLLTIAPISMIYQRMINTFFRISKL
ncbi:acyltransferase family protein [Sediminitomix flava]|uniref:Peptidoglycan/LPS O-acetylase OafA/YrhL n=1 Tax=Sediminitomix flava TaxID=379075 RepID=A0A315ZDR9_SEDFL|nr:acyltransferase [Sediminitomix flava]PWJ43269.1 peptidoglycan/LPS O-acetylase OafA/YrhL [Sediminitomix flava]